jgi:hypothetical protein
MDLHIHLQDSTVNIYELPKNDSEYIGLLRSVADKLTKLENLIMPSIQEFQDDLNALALQVSTNNSLIDSIRVITVKIFDEVDALVKAQNNGEVPIALVEGLANLKAAVLAQTPVIAAAAAEATSVDELNPDLNPEVVNPLTVG